MVRHREWKPCDDDIGERLARHIHALPKAIQPEQHRVGVLLEIFQHSRARGAGALHKAFNAQFIKYRLHLLGHLLHQLAVGEQHKRLPARHFHEVTNPFHQCCCILIIARIGHLASDIQLHLLFIDKRRPQLGAPGILRPHAVDEKIKAQALSRRCLIPLRILNGQRGTGTDGGGAGVKHPSTQILRNVDGRGIHGNPALHPAGALDPVDMLLGALAQENAYRITQFTKAPIALHQLGGGFLVLSQLY